MNDLESLQQDLDSLSSQSDRWLLRFNSDKCKVMHIKHEIHTNYSIKQDGKEWPLQEVSEEKELGIVNMI